MKLLFGKIFEIQKIEKILYSKKNGEVRSTSLILLILVFSSCITSSRFKAKTKTGQPISIDTLNLVSVMVGPILQPALPIIDATAFNVKMNKISSEIIEAEREMVNSIKEDLITTLEKDLPCTIRTSKELNNPKINPYRIHSSATCENKSFPVVLFAEGDLKFQEFGSLDNVRAELYSNQFMRENIAEFAQQFDLGNVAICYYRVEVIEAFDVGSYGTARLVTHLLVFDRRGALVLSGQGVSLPSTITAGTVDAYIAQLQKYEISNNLLTIAISKQLLD